MDLTTKYMGLNLKNPIIVSSSRLTSTVEGVKNCANHGAGAVVLKSLFEEQILDEIDAKLSEDSMYFWYPDAANHVKDISKEHGVKEYINLIKECKKEVDIPVIASVNCITSNEWPSFAKQIEEAGADGLELNIAIFPFDENMESKEIEDKYIEIVKAVKENTSLPISVKIGCFFTNITSMVYRLCSAGISGLVLFNRFFRPDINIDTETVNYDNILSTSHEMTQSLRWIGSLYKKVKCDMAAATGVHYARGAIKQILAGATAAQVCSILYIKGVPYLETMIEDLKTWMEAHNYKSVDDFRGNVIKGKENLAAFERMQFMRKSTGTWY